MASIESNDGIQRENVINLVTEEEATGRVAEIYEEIQSNRDGDLDGDLGFSNLWRMFGNDETLLEIMWQHMDHSYNCGTLPYQLKSEISMVVATALGCEGCKFFHESALEQEGLDDADIERLKTLDFQDSPGFSDEERMILGFAEKAATDPHDITDEEFQALRDLGLTDAELLEVLDCIALHVYTAVIQATAGVVYSGMNRAEWTAPRD